MNGWEEVQLKDVVSILGDGLHGTPEYSDDGEYYFVNGNNLSDGSIVITQETKRVSHSEYLKYKKELGDRTLFVSINGTIGNIAYYKGEKIVLGKSACYFNLLESVDKDFIRYTLSTEYFQKYAHTYANGTTIKNLGLKAMREFSFSLPPLQEQQQIAATLSCLDRKIENLRRQNVTLEAIAQTLFNHWFVDFEFPNADGKPYKSSGGAMEPSELGDIPAAWRVGKLGEIYKTTSGGTPSRKEPDYYAEKGYLWVKSKELYSNFILHTEEKITPLGLKNSSAKLLPEKTILIAMYGATVGQISVLGVESTCNQAICAVLEQEYSNYFIYLWLKHTQKEWTGMAIGSAQQNLSQVLISKIEIVIPTLDIHYRFSSVVSPIFQKMLVHARQIETLTKTRDELLPKLMSGKLRVTL